MMVETHKKFFLRSGPTYKKFLVTAGYEKLVERLCGFKICLFFLLVGVSFAP